MHTALLSAWCGSMVEDCVCQWVEGVECRGKVEGGEYKRTGRDEF